MPIKISISRYIYLQHQVTAVSLDADRQRSRSVCKNELCNHMEMTNKLNIHFHHWWFLMTFHCKKNCMREHLHTNETVSRNKASTYKLYPHFLIDTTNMLHGKIPTMYTDNNTFFLNQWSYMFQLAMIIRGFNSTTQWISMSLTVFHTTMWPLIITSSQNMQVTDLE
jgi:hypothetical protein